MFRWTLVLAEEWVRFKKQRLADDLADDVIGSGLAVPRDVSLDFEQVSC